MSESGLMQVLANAAGVLAAADAPEATVERVLVSVGRELSGTATIGWDRGRVSVTWHDGGGDEERDAFAEALTALVELAGRSEARGQGRVLDAAGFALAVDRVAAGARWRGARMAVAAFEVEGMLLGPGIDESLLVETVGEAARQAVRADDVVGHLGASYFGLLFPRAGTFEARAAYRRVRDAVMRIEGGGELHCGAAGFAELEPGQTGAELLGQARGRMSAARVRSAYTSPGGGTPTQPLAG